MPVPIFGRASAITAATASEGLRPIWPSSMFSQKSVGPRFGTHGPTSFFAASTVIRAKGKSVWLFADYFWPDRDNTLRAFEYVNGLLVQPHADLTAMAQSRARDTIALTGLDKFPGNQGREPTASDQRWLRRQEAWQLAKRSRARLAGQDTTAMREQIVETAIGRGMFCIWWTVFAGDVDMRRRLRGAFVGTHAASFDINENPVPRAGGQL